jgi:DEAD/DEAH box helicase domain-containing protein
MIPSVLAHQVQHGVKDFLRTTFPIATPHFHLLLENLLEREDGIFQGPYLSINLPFRQGKGCADFFPEVPLKFPPYLYQEQAFGRLSGAHPRSTIVATGTGSGKTECFLYPILDMCQQHRGEPGIKVILIYPMNALAMDQAGRLAETIWNKLKGSVTAGLFVGQSEREPRSGMGPDGIVTNKENLRLKPPDILLTHYKMLDYLLIRAKDRPHRSTGRQRVQPDGGQCAPLRPLLLCRPDGDDLRQSRASGGLPQCLGLTFIETLQTELLDRFLELFSDSLTDDSKDRLGRFVR